MLLTRLLCITALLGVPVAAMADKPRFGDTLTISVGGMNHRGKAQFASTRPGAPVTKLSFTDLGFDDETSVFWGDVTWQFAERWQFRLNYSSFDADGLREARESGNFGDLEWSVGARLTSDFDMRLYIADVTWDFIKTDRLHIGAGVGVHAVDLNLDMLLEVEGSIGGAGGGTEFALETASVLAPLPNVSLGGGYRLADQLYLSARFGYLSLSYDKYDGRLFSARGAVEWRPVKRFGVGLAYQHVDVDLEVDDTTKQELYDFEFRGPVVYASVGF
jgi:hypothetical protein